MSRPLITFINNTRGLQRLQRSTQSQKLLSTRNTSSLRLASTSSSSYSSSSSKTLPSPSPPSIPSLHKQSHLKPPTLFSNHLFSEWDIHPLLLKSLQRLNITRATVCQARSFVPLSVGRDAVIASETGSGKTLSYLLPIINRIYYACDGGGGVGGDGDVGVGDSVGGDGGVGSYDREVDTSTYSSPDSSTDLYNSSANTNEAFTRPLRIPPVAIVCPNYELCAQVISMCFELDYYGNNVSVQTLVRLPDMAFGLRGRDNCRDDNNHINHDNDYTEKTDASHSDIEEENNRIPTNPNRKPSRIPYFSPRIRFGLVDIVVTTPTHLILEFERLQQSRATKGISMSTIIIDEVDLIVHSTKHDFFDILKYTRPRAPFNSRNQRGLSSITGIPGIPGLSTMPGLSNPTNTDYSYAISCQFVLVSATIPALGPTSCGSLLSERFVSAEQIITPGAHTLPDNFDVYWIEEEKQKNKMNYMNGLEDVV